MKDVSIEELKKQKRLIEKQIKELENGKRLAETESGRARFGWIQHGRRETNRAWCIWYYSQYLGEEGEAFPTQPSYRKLVQGYDKGEVLWALDEVISEFQELREVIKQKGDF